jgi:hypothetical protein
MRKAGQDVRCIIVVLICLIFFMSGCASAGKKPDNQVYNYENKVIQTRQETFFDADTIVVRAKRLTRLEIKKREAVRKNNKETVVVIAGSAAAITAYIVSDAFFRVKNNRDNPLATMCITAAAAYLAASITGFIYDVITGY